MSSNHTGKVRKFAEELLIPTEIIIGGRAYRTLPLFKEGENSVGGNVMKEMAALISNEERQHILDYQADIPSGIRSVVTFVLAIWKTARLSRNVPVTIECLSWFKDAGSWVVHARGPAGEWRGCYRVLRRIS